MHAQEQVSAPLPWKRLATLAHQGPLSDARALSAAHSAQYPSLSLPYRASPEQASAWNPGQGVGDV